MTVLIGVLCILVILCFAGLAFAFRAIELQRQIIEKLEASHRRLSVQVEEQEERIDQLEEAVSEAQSPESSPLAQIPIVGPLLTGRKGELIASIGLIAWRTIAAYLRRREASKLPSKND